MRSSSTLTDKQLFAAAEATVKHVTKVPMPVDFEKLVEANQLDVELYHFAAAMQVRIDTCQKA